jgi:hypothetical protein
MRLLPILFGIGSWLKGGKIKKTHDINIFIKKNRVILFDLHHFIRGLSIFL